MTADHYLTRFDTLLDARDEPAWLTAHRRAAFARFQDVDVPTRKHEDWKYTSTKDIARTEFALPADHTVDPAQIAALQLEHLTGHRLVFINGVSAPDHSHIADLPPGVQLTSLAPALSDESPVWLRDALTPDPASERHPFALLNAAFATDGVLLHVPRNVVVETPIQIIQLAVNTKAPSVAHPRLLIRAEDFSQVTLVETYAGHVEAPYLTNAVTHVTLGTGAHVRHVKLQHEHTDKGHHVALTRINQARDSNYANHTFAFGAAWARNDIDAYLGGENITTTLNGLFLARGNQHTDTHTTIDHAHPHCNSFEHYKGVLDGHATGVFNGKIFVRQIAQKTDAKQANNNLLLSPNATINTKPQLEIWADDVRCTHGATIGQLDNDALFYLRTRGLPEHEARSLLTFAFGNELIEQVPLEPVREYLEGVLSSWL